MKQAENIVSEELQAVASPPLSDDLLARMRPVNEAHPEIPARVRGPQKNVLKDRITIRLDHEVVEFFKSHGRGWQTRINDALLEYVHLRHGGGLFQFVCVFKTLAIYKWRNLLIFDNIIDCYVFGACF